MFFTVYGLRTELFVDYCQFIGLWFYTIISHIPIWLSIHLLSHKTFYIKKYNKLFCHLA